MEISCQSDLVLPVTTINIGNCDLDSSVPDCSSDRGGESPARTSREVTFIQLEVRADTGPALQFDAVLGWV